MTDDEVTTAGAPQRLLLWSEPGRATAEFGSLLVAAPLLRRAPRGDGHTVVVLPGFLADDRSTLVLRHFVGLLGYRAYGWELGRNVGPTERILSGMTDLVQRVAASSGRPVSLLGWSLGGMFARALAQQHPDAVRQVVTLGSPFRSEGPIGSHATSRFNRLSHLHVPLSQLPPPEADRDPLAMPLSALYSRADGIVSWQSCVQAAGPRRESVEVRGSHCGMGHNPAALWVVADRLGQPAGEWRPFAAPAYLRGLFPRASSEALGPLAA